MSEQPTIVISPKYKSLWQSDARYHIITGGRGSGKSYTVALFLLTTTFEEGHVILFTRYTLVSAKTSIIPQFIEVMESMGYSSDHFDVTQDQIVNKQTGSKILFKGIKTSSGVQTAALKSLTGVTTWVLDEAEELVDEDLYQKIDYSVRVKGIKNRVILVMNPTTKEHWIYQKYFESGDYPNTNYIHTTYLDNIDHISEDVVSEYNLLKESNIKRYNHIVLGGWLDKAEGVIFTNWEHGEFAEHLPCVYGLDFGVDDPDALVKVAIDKRNKLIYLKECVYKNGLSTDELYSLVVSEVAKKTVIADLAGSRTIKDFRNKGINVKKCKKGAGSVLEGIKMMLGYKLIIQGSGLTRELNNYVWLDKKGEYPIDDYNHLIDAARYAVSFLLKERRGVII